EHTTGPGFEPGMQRRAAETPVRTGQMLWPEPWPPSTADLDALGPDDAAPPRHRRASRIRPARLALAIGALALIVALLSRGYFTGSDAGHAAAPPASLVGLPTVTPSPISVPTVEPSATATATPGQTKIPLGPVPSSVSAGAGSGADAHPTSSP